MLSLRKFESTMADMTSNGLGPQFREHMESTVLQFGAQPSDSLPPILSTFAQPIHVDEFLSETNLAAEVDGSREEETEAPDPERPLSEGPAHDQTSGFEAPV